MDLPAAENAPAPRLCHLVKWPDFDGYGFNLHAEKAKTGQYIGKVDDGSPAELAGLREGDRIIEVNGVNIANENHRQVVERIKAMVNETKLLVLDEEGDKYYKERKLVVKGTQANVIYKKTPPTQPSAESSEKVSVEVKEEAKVVTPAPEIAESRKTKEESNNAIPEKKVKTPTTPKKTVEQNGRRESNTSAEKVPVVNGSHSSPAIEKSHKSKQDSPKPAKNPIAKTESPKPVSKSQNGSSNGNATPKPAITNSVSNGNGTTNGTKNGSAPQNGTSTTATTAQNGTATSVPAQNGSSSPGVTGGDLNLNMSAAQMREMLANRKKRDPRNQSQDMREKYQIVQQM